MASLLDKSPPGQVSMSKTVDRLTLQPQPQRYSEAAAQLALQAVAKALPMPMPMTAHRVHASMPDIEDPRPVREITIITGILITGNYRYFSRRRDF
jgi:hypothetical protein